MAGPFTDQALGQLNVDEIVGQGLAATGAVPTDTATADTPPIPSAEDPLNPRPSRTGRGGVQFGMEGNEWAYRPVQEDFGQVETAKYQSAGGQVPVARFQMPFPALANRQQAIAQRKEALAQKMAAFDPYKGTGEAHPRFQQAFSKYAVNEMDRRMKEYAQSAFGGDMRQASRFFASDPEGQQLIGKWSREVEGLGAANKAFVTDGINLLTKVATGEYYIPPDRQEKLLQYTSTLDENGIPVTGETAEEFLPKARENSFMVQEAQYINEAITPGVKNAMMTTIGVDIDPKKRIGGKIVIDETQVETYESFIDQAARGTPGFVENYADGDVEKAKDILRAYFPTSVKKKVQMESPYTPPSSGSSSASAKAVEQGRYGVSYSRLPSQALKRTVVGKDGKEEVKEVAGSDAEFPTINLYDIRSNQGVFPAAREFNTGGTVTMQDGRVVADDKKANKITMHPTDIMNVGGKLFIVGRKTGQPRTTAKGGSGGGGGRPSAGGEGGEDIQDFNQLEQVIIPYDGNEAMIKGSFGMEDQEIKSALGWTGGKQNNARIQKGSTGGAKPAVSAPPVGTVKNGYKFKGGDPSKPESWQKV